MSPALEIIIPLRNPGAELVPTVASLVSQTDRDFSVLLCDDLSTKGLDHLAEAQKQLTAAGIAVRCIKPPFELWRIEHWNWSHSESPPECFKPLPPPPPFNPPYIHHLNHPIS